MHIYNKIKTDEIKTKDLQFSILKSGDIHQIRHNNDCINAYKGTAIEGSVANLYLRIKKHDGFSYTKLIGIDSPSSYAIKDNQVYYKGKFENIEYLVTLTINDDKWFYDIDLTCNDDSTVSLYYGQDLLLNGSWANEAYSCQYIDHKVCENELGYHVISRQNQGNPYLIEQGSLTKNVGYSTDGFQFFGLDYKFTNIPLAIKEDKLENRNYQYEFAYIAFKAVPKFINNHAHITFYSYFKAIDRDYPTSLINFEEIDNEHKLIKLGNIDSLTFSKMERTINLNDIYTSPSLTIDEINKLFPNRHLEEKIDNQLVSFFINNSEHVVLANKEYYLERPHGNVIISNGCKEIQDSPLATTSYIFGVFNSHVVVGNTNINKFNTDLKNPLNVVKLSGERILVKIDGKYRLLGMPSVYLMGISSSTHYYKIKDDILKIEVAIKYDQPLIEMEVTSLNNVKYDIMIVNHLLMGESEYTHQIILTKQGNTLTYTGTSDNFMHMKYPKLKYVEIYDNEDVVFNNDESFLYEHYDEYPLITASFKNTSKIKKRLLGLLHGEEIVPGIQSIEDIKLEYLLQFKRNTNYFKLSFKSDENIAKLNDIFMWYTHNALIHYASPHGLEQYGGAAWGTRDVCQGPLELFLALNRFDLAKDIIKKVYGRQFLQTGDWPQWFMFDEYMTIQAMESHGDIILWPLHALSYYLTATNDVSILDEKMPYVDKTTGMYTQSKETIFQHIVKEIDAIKASFVPGTFLSKYGGGDWDDTLQPYHRELTEKMVSGWTVALTIETFSLFYKAIESYNSQYASEIKTLTEHMIEDYNEFIIHDQVPAGFVYFTDEVKYMLHPSDDQTKIKYRLLPFNQGITAELFNEKQIKNYLPLIDKNLKHPDGVRLMSDTVEYKGGKNTFFIRAETASNFGREIGLQYVHAHIRYIEAMAKLNESRRVYDGLFMINPINISSYVKNALPRQSNMYFSSSDGCFYDRYEAKKDFNKLRTGRIKVKGGWRLYSSGPGIYLYQIICNFLGIKHYHCDLLIDPCVTSNLDGLHLDYMFDDKVIHINYHISNDSSVVSKVILNGKEVLDKVKVNSYKPELFVIKKALLKANNEINIYI
jgi:cellobiose phosphorylase